MTTAGTTQQQNSARCAARAIDFLVRTRNIHDGGWGYTPGQKSAAEPSCFCSLALLGAGADGAPSNAQWALLDAPQLATSGVQWALPMRLLALRRMGQSPEKQKQLIDALLARRGEPIDSKKPSNGVDRSLVGWTWVDGTFSWVEPTSYALLALKSTGVFDHARVKEAEKLLLNRRCEDGGWNYGSKFIRGVPAGSMTSTTALAALALQRAGGGAEKAVPTAMDWLDRETQATPSTLSLALSVLCLHSYGRSCEHLLRLLEARQSEDGSWRGQPHLTGLAVLALQTRKGKNVLKV